MLKGDFFRRGVGVNSGVGAEVGVETGLIPWLIILEIVGRDKAVEVRDDNSVVFDIVNWAQQSSFCAHSQDTDWLDSSSIGILFFWQKC